MDRQLERCCGLDVHKETISACVRIGGRSGQVGQHVQTFRTTAADLVVLHDWLVAHGVTHVAMESTGVYWKPVFYALENDFTCLLVNAAHKRQPLVAHGPDRSSRRRESGEGQRASSAVSTCPPSSRSEKGSRRLGPHAPAHRLPHLGARHDLPRAWRRLL